MVPSYLPAWRYGGPIRSVHGLCKALAQAGHEVEVFTTNADGPGELDVPVAEPVDVEGVRVWYFPDRVRRLYWSPAMGAALSARIATFDIAHLHSIYLWPTTAAAHRARDAGIPYVLSPRGMLMRELIEGKSRWVKRAWIAAFERSNLKHAAAVHFTSAREAEEAAAFGLRFQRVCVVPNGSDGALAEAPARPEVATPFLLFIGRLSWEKGLDRLLRALAHAPGIELRIAGDGDPALREKLQQVAATSGVAQRVRFLGPVDAAEKSRLLAQAAALVLPSYSESFGNVVLEAMAAGCPVVVTPEVGAAEVVHATRSGLVLEGEPASLGRGIRELLADPESRLAMGRRGREAFLHDYTWQAVAARMLAAYGDATRGGAR